MFGEFGPGGLDSGILMNSRKKAKNSDKSLDPLSRNGRREL